MENLGLTALLRQAYAGHRVLITGHTGFKGAWLALWLSELGAKVAGFALPPPTVPSLFELTNLRSRLTHHLLADIRNPEDTHRALEETAPEFIFHLAAQPLVRESYRSPRDTFETNVMGTINLLDAVRLGGRPCVVVIVTSDKCYENRERTEGYREEEPLGGHDPYSASKGAAELVAASYRRSFFPPDDLENHGIRLATARAGNVIGGGDWAPDRIMVDCIRALVAGQPVGIRNPAAVRPWQHVLEPLGGYLCLAARCAGDHGAEFTEAWNFGPAAESVKTVRELVDATIAAWGAGRWQDIGVPGAPHEARLLALNCAKANARLGWHPAWNFDQAVRHTTAWYRAWHRGHPALADFTLDQIRDYQHACDRQPP